MSCDLQQLASIQNNTVAGTVVGAFVQGNIGSVIFSNDTLRPSALRAINLARSVNAVLPMKIFVRLQTVQHTFELFPHFPRERLEIGMLRQGIPDVDFYPATRGPTDIPPRVSPEPLWAFARHFPTQGRNAGP